MTTSIEPKMIESKLAPPGAGIGFFPSLVLRYFVRPVVASRSKRHESKELFDRINQKILKEIEGLTEEQLTTRVLIPPQSGIEDSSRYWSIRMTLEHLCIVTPMMYRVIQELSEGRVPEGQADTAAVKPVDQTPTKNTIQKFESMITSDFEKLESEFSNFNSPTKFLHPWFGPMNAASWYWLLGVHHRIHLKQIREIKKGLPLL